VGIVVQKYGGSSVADARSVKRVAQRIVATKRAGSDVVVVVSAMGDTTDELLEPRQPGVAAAEPTRAGHAADRRGAHLDGAAGDGHHQPRHEARSFTGSQAGVITDSTHGKAKIIDVTPGRIEQAVAEGAIAIVAGFQGVSQSSKDITTLGGAAPTPPAVALAAALGAEVCEIYTDVDGVFTADPRIVPTARRIPAISYEEMLEMAASGAKILHLRCVEYARRHNMPIHVRSSFSHKTGTWVVDSSKVDKHGTGDHLRRRARPQRGQDHGGRGAGQGR
jgi:aspartate kinase